MNNLPATTLIAWQTRNGKRQRKALIWCKDYGLKQLLPNIAIGNLYGREQRLLLAKFKRDFTKKTDRFFYVKICQTCYAGADFGDWFKDNTFEMANFEFIQIPTAKPQRRKKAQ